MDRDTALLSALRAALAEAGSTSLPAERVRTLGAAAGLSDAELAQRIDALAREGLLRLRWGGEVELTEKALERPSGPPGRIPTVQVGHGSIVQIGSPNAVAGPGAIGAGAVVVPRPVQPDRVGEHIQRPAAAGDEKPRRPRLLDGVTIFGERIVWMDKVLTAVRRLGRWFGLGP